MFINKRPGLQMLHKTVPMPASVIYSWGALYQCAICGRKLGLGGEGFDSKAAQWN